MVEKPIFISKYQIIEDEDIYGRRKGYILENIEREKYINIPESKICFVENIIQLMDGKHNIEQINYEIERKFGRRVDLEGIYRCFVIHGFIENDETNMCTDELGLLSKEILCIKFKTTPMWICRLSYIIKGLAKVIYFLLFLFSIVTMGAYCKCNIVSLVNIIKSNIDIKENLMLTAIIVSISMILHEISHVIVALSHQRGIKKISFNLYAGCIPMIYVRFKRMNSLSAKKRLSVVMAGIITNFMLGLTLISIGLLGGSRVSITSTFITCGCINLYSVVINLLPFSLTDGYFLLSILLGDYSIRTTILWQIFTKSKKTNISRKRQIFYFIYCMFSVSVVCISLYTVFLYIIKLVAKGNQWSIVYALLIGGLVFMSIRKIRKNLKRYSKR